MRTLLRIAFGCALIVGQSQQSVSPPVIISPDSLLAPTDCTKPELAGFACRSFNDMLKAGDKDLVRRLMGGQQAYVCFRDEDDVFTVLNFTKRDDGAMQKVSASRYEEPAVVEFVRFSKGVEDDSGMAMGKWWRFASMPIDDAMLRADDSSLGPAANDLHIDINSSEVLLTYKWKNLAGTSTHYRLQIRRSTKRMLEEMEGAAAGDPKKPISNKAQTKITETGFCVEYNN